METEFVDLIGGPLDGQKHELLPVFGLNLRPSLMKIPDPKNPGHLLAYELEDSGAYRFKPLA